MKQCLPAVVARIRLFEGSEVSCVSDQLINYWLQTLALAVYVFLKLPEYSAHCNSSLLS